MAVEAKTEFEKILQDHHFASRQKSLGKLGRDLKALNLSPQDLVDKVASIAPEPAQTFEELARLVVARSAGAVGYAGRLLDHASQAVRRQAVESGLLTSDQGKEAFLSPDSSRQLKSWLVHSPCIEVDDAVLEQAQHLFNNQAVWALLSRTNDEEFFKRHIQPLKPSLSSLSTARSMPHVARKFPEACFDLLPHFNRLEWDWLVELLQRLPDKVLHYCLKNQNKVAFGQAVFWGWRYHPAIMKDICKEVSFTQCVAIIDHLQCSQAKVMYVTANMKVKYLVEVFASRPDKEHEQSQAETFVKRFPKLEEHRQKELSAVIDGFWQIVSNLGRLRRKDALEFNECSIFRTFAKLLPAELAVGQFMKFLEETKPSYSVFEFVQSEVCITKDGKNDELMKQVFLKYLEREECSKDMAKLFQKLLKDCKTMDVIQEAFDALTERLGENTEHGLLLSVVARMKQLQGEYDTKVANKAKAEHPEKIELRLDATLAIPIHWVHFVELPNRGAGVSPYVSFLHLVLHCGTGDSELLGAAVARYGRIYYWDSLEEVMTSIGKDMNRKRQALIQTQGPDLNVIGTIDVAQFKAITSTGRARGGGDRNKVPSPNVYFEKVDEIKKETFGRCPIKRESGYTTLIRLAAKDRSPEAYKDVMTFVGARLVSEQDNIRAEVMSAMLGGSKPALPVEEWKNYLEQLQALFKSSTKNLNIEFEGPRHAQLKIWIHVGETLVKNALRDWKDDQQEPSEDCLTGVGFLEVLLKSTNPTLSLANHFEWAAGRVHAESESNKMIPAAAAQWTLEKVLSLLPDPSAQLTEFLPKLKIMARGLPTGKDKLRQLWSSWKFLEGLWSKVLSEAVSQKTAHLIMVDLPKSVLSEQLREAEADKDNDKWIFWWDPLTSDSYQTALSGVFELIDNREIPQVEAARLLQARILTLGAKTELEAIEPPSKIVRGSGHQWNSTQVSPNFSPEEDSKLWYNQTVVSSKFPEETLLRGKDSAREVKLLRQVLAKATPTELRSVLWSVLDIALAVPGESMSELLEDAIWKCNPDMEGKARCVARKFPYLRQALAMSHQYTDLLSPMVEMWLTCHPSVQEERVKKLMSRDDCELFLFFGAKFGEFLSHFRQDWLHQCLAKLRPLSSDSYEFYHFALNGPPIYRVAMYRKMWRFEKQRQAINKTVEGKRPIFTSLWHKDTQTQFADKALMSSYPIEMDLVAALHYIDGTKRASELLRQFPKEQEGASPDAAFVVIQPVGTCEDAQAEVERRFLECGPPALQNRVGEAEVEQVLTSLGFMDDSIAALRVLGEYAGKVKKAKDAVIRAVPNLSPKQARLLVRDVMLGPKAGVSLCVAAVRLVADLHMPQPLELYRKAWRNGKCHRDVVANILSRLSTAPLMDATPEEVRPFFDFFTIQSRSEDYAYVGEQFCTQLKTVDQWTLSYVPGIVADVAIESRNPNAAVTALSAVNNFETEVVQAFTQIVQHVQLAMLASKIGDSSNSSTEFQVIRELADYGPSKCLQQVKKRAESVTLPVLAEFLKELKPFAPPSGSQVVLAELLSFWALLWRPEPAETWNEILPAMEQWTIAYGGTGDACWKDLAVIAIKRASDMVDEMKVEDVEAAKALRLKSVTAVTPLVERILVERLDKGALSKDPAKQRAAKPILHAWGSLLCKGSVPADSAKLFAQCPETSAEDLVTKIVDECLADPASKKGQAATKNPCASVAFEAFTWLATFRVQDHENALFKLGAQLAKSQRPNTPDFKAVIEKLGNLTRAQTTNFCTTVVDLEPPRNVGKDAVNWLATVSPADAAVLWPKVLPLGPNGGSIPTAHLMDATDIQTLLNLCKAQKVPFPEVDSRSCQLAALPILAKCEFPQARLLTVRVMHERDLGHEASESDLLKELKNDPAVVVKFSAKLLWARLHPEEAKQKKEKAKYKLGEEPEEAEEEEPVEDED